MPLGYQRAKPNITATYTKFCTARTNA